MSRAPLHTARSHELPTVQQLSIFIEERVGQLMRLTRIFDGTDVHILGLSVAYEADVAIVRLIVDRPEEATLLLGQKGIAVTQNEVAVAQVPSGPTGLQMVFSALLRGEVSILYVYPLLPQIPSPTDPVPRPALVLRVDELATAVSTLISQGITVLSQEDLASAF